MYTVVVQPLSCAWFFATPWTTVHPTPLSSSISLRLLRFMSTESVMLSNYLVLCHPLLLLPSMFPSIRAFSNELVLHIRWPKYWSFSFSNGPSIDQCWFPLGMTGLIFLLPKELSRVFSRITIENHQFFGTQPFLWSNFHIHTWLLEKP